MDINELMDKIERIESEIQTSDSFFIQSKYIEVKNLYSILDEYLNSPKIRKPIGFDRDGFPIY